MDKEEIRRRLDKLPTADEIREHYYTMRQEHQSPQRIEWVYQGHKAEQAKAERRYHHYLKEFNRWPKEEVSK